MVFDKKLQSSSTAVYLLIGAELCINGAICLGMFIHDSCVLVH